MTKKRIFQIIEKANRGDKASKIFDLFILVLIALNILSIILESHANLRAHYKQAFYLFEIFSVIVFTSEYLLRLWTADIKFPHLKRTQAIAKQASLPLSLIDLFAILPFYLPILLPFDLRFLRLFRMARFFRILKLNRYSNALRLIFKVLKNKKDTLLATFYILFITILSSSIFMYYAENSVQPDRFSSITATLWWAVATLTTVGYGDIYPITVVGKILATIISITGIGIVALPTGIISSGFIEEIDKSKKVCPHCKKPLT